jgi:hypothetical protein
MTKHATGTARFTARAEFSARGVVRMGTATMVRGYVLATRRLRDAVDRSHPEDIYIALFEATNLLDSLSEEPISEEPRLNSRGEVQAIKLLRNRTHHQWASAVRRHDDGNWRWRPLGELAFDPEYKNEKLKPSYKRHLEGKPVVETFRQLEPHVTALAPNVDLS